MIREFLTKCTRVWIILKKPSMEEFNAIAKVSALGILVIGFIGFIINLLFHIWK